jgi:hypothetical protein
VDGGIAPEDDATVDGGIAPEDDATVDGERRTRSRE